MEERSVSMFYKFDLSKGVCGVPHPKLDVKCYIPNDGGKALHLLWGGHVGQDSKGTDHGWHD